MARHLANQQDDHYTTHSPENVMPRKDNVLTQPVPLGIAALIAAAIMGVFGWGFSILDSSISELRTETDGIRQSIGSLAESSHQDSLQMSGRIDSVSAQLNGRIDAVSAQLNGRIDSVAAGLTVTNTKLDDLIAVTKERKR